MGENTRKKVEKMVIKKLNDDDIVFLNSKGSGCYIDQVPLHNTEDWLIQLSITKRFFYATFFYCIIFSAFYDTIFPFQIYQKSFCIAFSLLYKYKPFLWHENNFSTICLLLIFSYVWYMIPGISFSDTAQRKLKSFVCINK